MICSFSKSSQVLQYGNILQCTQRHYAIMALTCIVVSLYTIVITETKCRTINDANFKLLVYSQGKLWFAECCAELLRYKGKK